MTAVAGGTGTVKEKEGTTAPAHALSTAALEVSRQMGIKREDLEKHIAKKEALLAE